MFRQISLFGAAAIGLAASVWLSSPARAGLLNGEEFTAEEANCQGLKLDRAGGVPEGAKHFYHFIGTCFDGNTRFPAEATVNWDRSTHTLNEDFSIIGTFVNKDHRQYKGHVLSAFKCNDDPLVVGAAACNGVSHTNETGAKFLTRPYNELHRPITKGKTNMDEAKKISLATAAAVAKAVQAGRKN